MISANSQINPIENTKIQEKYLVESFQQKEKYEIFFEAKENEELKNFEVFKHYVLIELISDRKEFFKGIFLPLI